LTKTIQIVAYFNVLSMMSYLTSNIN